jgi:hypothetical protein
MSCRYCTARANWRSHTLDWGLRDGPLLQDKLQEIAVFRKSHEDVVFGFALKDTVDVDEVGVVDFDEDVELSGEELFHEISGGSGGIHDFAR